MQRALIPSTLLACLLLQGCFGVGSEDPRIVTQCGWLEESAAPNISISGTLSAFIFGGVGGAYSRESTVYSSEDAGDRDLLLAACKLNAVGSPRMTDEMYSDTQSKIIALRGKRIGIDLTDTKSISEADLAQLASLTGTTVEKILSRYKEDSSKSDAERKAEYNALATNIVDASRKYLDRFDRVDSRLDSISTQLRDLEVRTAGPTTPAPDVFIYFDYNKDAPFSDMAMALGTSLVVAKQRHLSVSIEGFADEQGDDARSSSLSLRRAQYVANLLQAAGISVSSVRGSGKTTEFGNSFSANRVVRVRFLAN